jgi:hypothetical protein
MDFARLWRCFFGALLVAATLATAQDDDDSLASSFFSGQSLPLLVSEFFTPLEQSSTLVNLTHREVLISVITFAKLL